MQSTQVNFCNLRRSLIKSPKNVKKKLVFMVCAYLDILELASMEKSSQVHHKKTDKNQNRHLFCQRLTDDVNLVTVLY